MRRCVVWISFCNSVTDNFRVLVRIFASLAAHSSIDILRGTLNSKTLDWLLLPTLLPTSSASESESEGCELSNK